MAAVRGLADEILGRHDRLDVLVNNAGLISPHYRLSEDGFELTFAVNHLAPFLLTNLLLDRLKTSAPARVITVASRAHRGSRIDLATITGSRAWSMGKSYGRSKLCNILFTRELARRLEGTGVTATCLHPGGVATGFGQRGGLVELGWRLAKPFIISPEKGGETTLFLATIADENDLVRPAISSIAPLHDARQRGIERSENAAGKGEQQHDQYCAQDE